MTAPTDCYSDVLPARLPVAIAHSAITSAQALERFGETKGDRLPVRTVIILFTNRKMGAVRH